MRYWAFLSLVVVLSSCADLKKTEQLERIDAMESKIDQIDSILKEIESLNPDAKIVAYNEQLERVKLLESDTISIAEAKVINDWKALREDLESLETYHTRGSSDIEFVKVRLVKLRSDIELGSGRRIKYNEYLKNEEALIGKLKGYFDRSRDKLDSVKENWESFSNQVNDILNERLSIEEVQ